MNNKTFNNADSFVMSFDEEWGKINCDDLNIKIEKVIEVLCDHPFVISNPEKSREIANFRIFSLKKLR